MSRPGSSKDGLSETFQEVLANVAKGLLGLGAFVTLIATGLLVWTCIRVGGDAKLTAEAMKNVAVFKEVLTFGAIGVAVGGAYQFWGEETGPAIMLAAAALLFFAPTWVPFIASAGTNEASEAAMGAIQNGGGIIGAVAALTLVIDVAGKARMRMKVGVKADSLKYGKGIKEEKDRRNVFMGKCWQLPYCRKFVRERCPIFHAKRTCWRERVGCMCEEEVIRVAMEGKTISKERLLDGSAIPRNRKLTEKQKFERCKNCVIYNEHQRHKYRAVVPAVLLGFGLVYLLGHTALIGAISSGVDAVDRAFHNSVLVKGQTEIPVFVTEGLLFFIMLLLLTYAMKLVEFMVFKLKL